MIIAKNTENNREFEILYCECSRIQYDEDKIKNDEIKVLRECNSSMDFSHATNNISTEFRIVRIQIAGRDDMIKLSVLF